MDPSRRSDPAPQLDWTHFRWSNFFVLAAALPFPFLLHLINSDLRDNVALLVFLLTLPVWLLFGEFWEQVEPVQQTCFLVWVALSCVLIGAFLQRPRKRLSLLLLFNLAIAILFAWAGFYGSLANYLGQPMWPLVLLATVVALVQSICLAIPLRPPAPPETPLS